MRNKNVKILSGIALLVAIEIIVQVVGNLITLPGGINLNLSLVPITLGAIIYGPFAGAFLGLVNGSIVLFSPSTQAFFMSFAPLGTVITCLVKTTAAGFISGLIFRLIAKKNNALATIMASLIVPIINSGLFVAACFTLLLPAIKANNVANAELYKFVFLTMINWNFIVEILVTAILSPLIVKTISYISKK